ncbi:hypothetical protein L0128_18200, partial [candidate division KSB1 bacterium]|nr:hypothetical protein [candidate division KSB1 bacterium]
MTCEKNTRRTEQFYQILLEDLRHALDQHHARFAASTATRADLPHLQNYAYVLASLTHCHQLTGVIQYQTWAHADLLRLVSLAVQFQDETPPLLTSFRFLTPFCEAFHTLNQQQLFSAAETMAVTDLIRATVQTHLDYTDYGPHNRATVDAAGFLAAAHAAPTARETATWQQYGAALLADSWGKWSIEDASIYNPFWLFFLLIAAEIRQRVPECMNFMTTRFYFEFYRRLLMPNHLMPDWGDGDLTHSWNWFFADLVRAGSYYGNGHYLDAAYRMYLAHRAQGLSGVPVYALNTDGLQGDAIFAVSTALRWLDRNVVLETEPLTHSEEVLEDLVTKKIVFRNHHDTASAYALLNYRDQGPYGRAARDYLNQQLAAYEEKPHHGHADENALILLMDHATILLADGGYVRKFHDGWRADYFHNRMVARLGWPIEGHVLDYLFQNKEYQPVTTEKIHFENFGWLDYSRTRLIDDARGYTADRIILFLVEPGWYIVVDAVEIDRPGHKLFVNMWHPAHILTQGEFSAESNHFVVSWPPQIPIRQDYWPNPHQRELLLQFLENRDKFTETKIIDRCYNPSAAFYQYLYSYFFKGQRLAFVTILTPHAPGTFTPQMLATVKIITTDQGSCRT